MKITTRGTAVVILVLQITTLLLVVITNSTVPKKTENTKHVKVTYMCVKITETPSPTHEINVYNTGVQEMNIHEDVGICETPQELYTEEEVDLIAKTVYGEARGCSYAEKRLVAWCICNRVDTGIWGSTIEEIVTYPGAFHGYNEDREPDGSCVKVAQEVLTEWRNGEQADILEPYATTNEYLYFGGDGEHNWFREEY